MSVFLIMLCIAFLLFFIGQSANIIRKRFGHLWKEFKYRLRTGTHLHTYIPSLSSSCLSIYCHHSLIRSLSSLVGKSLAEVNNAAASGEIVLSDDGDNDINDTLSPSSYHTNGLAPYTDNSNDNGDSNGSIASPKSTTELISMRSTHKATSNNDDDDDDPPPMPVLSSTPPPPPPPAPSTPSSSSLDDASPPPPPPSVV